jgi:hypothetical protein
MRNGLRPPSCAFESARLADRVCDIVLEGADRGVHGRRAKVRSLCRNIPRALERIDDNPQIKFSGVS